jgi:uncharacterized RDD family membrane protein YckC
VIAEPPRVEPAVERRLAPRFEQAEREFFALKGQLAAGRITQSGFDAAIKELMLQDVQGRYWMLGADSGKWYVYDGQAWVQAVPPLSEVGQATRPGPEAITVAPPIRPVSVAAGYQFAGFWRRLVAYLIDDALLTGLYYCLEGFGVINVIAHAMGYVAGRYFRTVGPPPAVPLLSGLLLLVDIVYRVGFWTWRGQTPGKMLLGIKIVKTDGTPVTFGKALVRYVGTWISGLALCLGYLWVGFDSRKQGWHDKIAGTYVVRAQRRP